VLNYVYSLCVFYYNVLSSVADVADCPLQRLSAIVIKNIIIIIIVLIHIESHKLTSHEAMKLLVAGHSSVVDNGLTLLSEAHHLIPAAILKPVITPCDPFNPTKDPIISGYQFSCVLYAASYA